MRDPITVFRQWQDDLCDFDEDLLRIEWASREDMGFKKGGEG